MPLIPETALKNWRARDDLRDRWEAFIKDEAFITGHAVLASFNEPKVFNGGHEPLEAMALRQAYHAGYAACLHRLLNLPDLHKQSHKGDHVVEWGGLVSTPES